MSDAPTPRLVPAVVRPPSRALPRAVALTGAVAAAAVSWTLLTPRHQRIHERAHPRAARPAPAHRPAAAPAPAVLERRLDRAALDALASTDGRVGARIVPTLRHGRPVGFKLYAIQPGSLPAAVGLENGDTLHRVNGHELSSPERALAAYEAVRGADRFELALTRAGKPLLIRVAVE